jgi:peptidoglycan/xylan/chitin deacetylase (PgdA/CDA1 family)
MYHAVRDADGRCAHADPHYAVGRAQFARHLDVAFEAGAAPTSVAALLSKRHSTTVAFTFDDGHASNAWAADTLATVGACADFFVNSSVVGTPGHLSWAALRDMSAAGMSIQSHCHRHRYLDELSFAEVDAELRVSKLTIEDRLGCAVELLAPPGGRMSRDMQRLAAEAGYTAVCSSRAGVWRCDGGWEVPRLAVLEGSSDTQLRRWIAQERWEVLRVRARQDLLQAARRVLGNGRYERFRHSVIQRVRAR